MNSVDDRRNFFRVLFERPATLTQGSMSWTCKVIDLSLKGALVSCPANWDESVGEVMLSFDLTDIPRHEDKTSIEMSMLVRHHETSVLGLECQQIDVDSASLLRRLIELNLGDESLLHRQLEHLIVS